MRIADCGTRISIRNHSALRTPHSAVLACAIFVSGAQATLPPLPRLSLDAYPLAAREAVARAYRDAAARSTDPAVVGTLAETLQAWDQWGAAHETYVRAQALAPRAFEWQYLDGLALQRL